LSTLTGAVAADGIHLLIANIPVAGRNIVACNVVRSSLILLLHIITSAGQCIFIQSGEP
jgi:hypothetical protein